MDATLPVPPPYQMLPADQVRPEYRHVAVVRNAASLRDCALLLRAGGLRLVYAVQVGEAYHLYVAVPRQAKAEVEEEVPCTPP